MPNSKVPATWKNDTNEQKRAIYQWLSYESLLYKLESLPDSIQGYEYSYLYVTNKKSKGVYYVRADGHLDTVLDASTDFAPLEQGLLGLKPEIEGGWRLDHEQFQQLITAQGGPTPRLALMTGPVLTAEADVDVDDSEQLDFLCRALTTFYEQFSDLEIELIPVLVARLIATHGSKNYLSALVTLHSDFSGKNENGIRCEFIDKPASLRTKIAETVFFAQWPMEVAEQMSSLVSNGFLEEGNQYWPYLSEVLKQSPEPHCYIKAVIALHQSDLDKKTRLLSEFLRNTQLTDENSFDLLLFLASSPNEQRLTYLRLSQHILSPFTQGVSDAQLTALFEQQLFQRFLQHVAYGQQDEAEDLLKTDINLAQELLMARKIPFTDYSGRTFKCSAYEYAYWAKDTHMCRMLEKYMDDNIKQELLKRVQKIEELIGDGLIKKPRGLAYTQKGTEYRSAHFELAPLIQALKDYTKAFNDSPKQSTANRRVLDAFWLKVGLAQRDLPAHLAQEYCHPDRSFGHVSMNVDLLDASKPENLKRQLKVYNYKTGKNESWFTPEGYSNDSGLGFSFAAYRSDVRWVGWHEVGGRIGLGSYYVAIDLSAIEAIDKERTKDLKQTLANLESSSSLQAIPSRDS